MSWIEDRIIVYVYKRPDGEEVILDLPVSEDPPETYMCEDGVEAAYVGFRPEAVTQTNMVTYDQNGREAVRIKRADGSVQHMSKTKLNYLKTGRIEHRYTKSYREHLMKTQQEQMLRTEHNKKRAKVGLASDLLDKIKKMPDGEYLSDGTNKVFEKPKENT